ncbi:hypothetical protein ACHAWF_010129 [Thalassiosira exigua]
MITSSPQSDAQTSLSPLSSRSAAKAERENIRRLRLECRGLLSALKRLDRNSKEWLAIKAKLDIASEELSCLLEDRMIQTPPLGTKKTLKDQHDVNFIPTPPLATKPQTKYDSPPATHDSNSAIEVKNIDEVPKYSLEWFQMKRLAREAYPKSKSEFIAPNHSRWARSPKSSVGRSSLKISGVGMPGPEQTDDALTEWEKNQDFLTDQLKHESVEDLSATLKTVPKYSLAWFTIKKEIALVIERETHRNNGIHQSLPPNLTNITDDIEEELKNAMMLNERARNQRRLTDKNSRSCLIDGSKTETHPPRPTDIRNRQKGCTDKRMNRLMDKLNAVPKYTLEYFQIKQQIDALKRDNTHDINGYIPVKKKRDHSKPKPLPPISPKARTKTKSASTTSTSFEGEVSSRA